MPSVFASASMRIKLGEMPMDMDRDSHRPTRPQPLPIAKATTELYFVSWARYPFAQVCPGGIVPCPHGCLDEHGLPRTQVVSTKITDVIGNKGIARYPFQVLIGQSGRSAFVTAEHSKCLLALGRCSGNAYRHTDAGVLQQLDTDYISYFPVYARTAGAPGGKLKSLLVTADVVDAHRTACTMGFGDANTAEVMVVNRSTSRDRDRVLYAKRAERWYRALSKRVADVVWVALSEAMQKGRALERAEFLLVKRRPNKVEADNELAREWESQIGVHALEVLLGGAYLAFQQEHKVDVECELEGEGVSEVASFDMTRRGGLKHQANGWLATIMSSQNIVVAQFVVKSAHMEHLRALFTETGARSNVTPKVLAVDDASGSMESPRNQFFKQTLGISQTINDYMHIQHRLQLLLNNAAGIS